MNARAAAALVGVDPSTIRRWARGGRLPVAEYDPRGTNTPRSFYRVADVVLAAASPPPIPRDQYVAWGRTGGRGNRKTRP